MPKHTAGFTVNVDSKGHGAFYRNGPAMPGFYIDASDRTSRLLILERDRTGAPFFRYQAVEPTEQVATPIWVPSGPELKWISGLGWLVTWRKRTVRCTSDRRSDVATRTAWGLSSDQAIFGYGEITVDLLGILRLNLATRTLGRFWRSRCLDGANDRLSREVNH